MPILKKTLFDEHLEKYNVLVNDIQSDSEYFKITELPDTFTGGKNAFLIQGSAQLVADTLVKIQIRDAKGKIIYYEPGMGIPQYYEGTSKVIAVYIYPDTAFGPCTITILGELSEYVDSNGIAQPVPQNWQGTYNVKWTKTVNVNPRLANTTKVRFYKRPKITISETILPIYTRTTNIITISGSMNGTAINPNAGVDYSTFNDVLQYQITLTDGTNFSSSMVGETYTINGLSASYTPTITQVLTNKTTLVNIPYYTTSSVNPSYQNVQSFISGAYTASFIQTVTVASSNVSSSYASIDITDLDAFTGNPKRIKVYASSLSDTANFSLLEDVPLEASQIFLTSSFNGALNVPTGYLSPSILSSFWNYFNINATTNVTQDNNTLYQSAVLKPSTDFSSSLGLIGFYYNKQIPFTKNTEYELDYTPLLSASAGFGGLSIYASGSAFLNTNSSLPYGKLIGSLTSNQSFYRYNAQRLNFKPDNDGTGSILFVVNGGTWQLANLSLAAAQDTAFSPNEVKLTVNVPTKIANETYDFKFEVYDVNNNFVPVSLNENFTFVGGNDSISYVITNVSSSISSSFGPLSSSFSGSLSQVSSSISGTITYNSSSVSSSILTLSGSVSGSIVTLSGSVSSSISSSLSSSFNYTSGSIYTLSGSVSSSLNSISSSISSSLYSANSSSLYTVYSASAYLNKFIFTDATGKINRPPTASAAGLYTGDAYLGFYSASQWRTYMDNTGHFYLTGSNSNFLAWDGSNLQVQGTINIQGGNGATTSSVSASINAATQSLSTSVATTTFTTATGLIAKPPTVLVGSTSGLYLGSSYLGYYDGNGWKTFMGNNGNFYLSGSNSDSLTWNSGTLTINGAINITGGNAATTTYVSTAAGNAATSASNAQTTANNALSGVASVGAYTSSIFTNSSGQINKTPSPTASGLYLGSTYLGYYNGSAWKTYMSNTGNFYLSGTGTNGLSWDGSSLSIVGTIKVSDGTEVTSTTISNANSALQSGQTGKSLGLTGGSVGGVTIASNKIYVGTGTWGNSNTGFYVDNTGQMSLKDKLTWDGSTLSITGNITVSGGNAATTSSVSTAQTTADNAASAASTAQTTANGKISAGGAASDVNSNTTTISGGKIRTGIIESTGYDYSSGNFSNVGTQINLDNGLIRSKNFAITSAGDALFKGSITGGTISIGSNFNVDSSGNITANSANLTGTVNATGGNIGGWNVSSGGSLSGISSVGQIILNPNAPNINFLDSSNITRLNLKLGSLTDPASSNNIAFSINSFSDYPSTFYSTTNNIIYGTANSFYVGTAGSYTSTTNYNYGSSYISLQTSDPFGGYAYIMAGYVIKDGSGNIIYAQEVVSNEGYGNGYNHTSYGNTNLQGQLIFSSPGTYYVVPYIDYAMAVYSGYVYNVNVVLQSQGSYTFNQQVSLSEISDYGMVISNSSTDYIVLNRVGYKIDTKGSIKIDSSTSGQYSYCNGVWHPYIGNTNDLGTTGNRWRTVWTTNALNSTSDRRFKNSIEDSDLGLDFINKLRPVKYKQNWSTSPRYHYGLIAQEVTSSLSDYNLSTNDVGFVASSSFDYTNEEIEVWKTQPNWESLENEISASMIGELGLSYTEFISPMIKAIQELTNRVVYLESKLSGSI
jgi:hypothetical protein